MDNISKQISSIDKISPYNKNNRDNSSENKNQKNKNEENDFQEVLDSELNKTALPKLTRTEFNAIKKIIYSSEEENEYDIKFAVVPIYLTRSYQEEMDIIGYIVSKCFVINKLDDGYEIVCPYNSVLEYNMPINMPKFENGKCVNSIFVPEVHNSFEYAEVIRDMKNANLDKKAIEDLKKYEDYFLEKTKNFDVINEGKFTY